MHTESCGAGCVTFSASPAAASLRVVARLGASAAVAEIPIRWRPRGSGTAERILRTAVASISRRRSFQIAERLSGGFGGPPALSHYRIAGRYNFAIVGHSAGPFEEIALGRRIWTLQPDGSRQQQIITPPTDTRELMPWWTHRSHVRLLDIRKLRGKWIAAIALADIRPPSVSSPFWFGVRVDLGSSRVLTMRRITAGHFMDQRYSAFDAPAGSSPVSPPAVAAQASDRMRRVVPWPTFVPAVSPKHRAQPRAEGVAIADRRWHVSVRMQEAVRDPSLRHPIEAALK